MALTALAIKHLKPKAKMYRVADSGGLCIEISPAGGKLWRWRYTFRGKAQMLALGKFPAVTLEQARRKRDEARLLVEAGKHPGREKKAQKLRHMVEGENTFEKVARHWHENRGGKLNKKYHAQCLVRMETHVFPKVGSLPITEITIPDVVRVVEKVGEKGTIATAKWVKQVMSQIFRYAAQRGMCQFNPAADVRDVLPPTEQKHYACIPLAELPALLLAMKAYSGDHLTTAALQLLALTFVRTGELIGAQWSEIDFDKAEWHIPKERMKMRRPHVVPLSRQALDVLKNLHKRTGTKANIFHSQRSRNVRHISNGAVLMALRRMGYQNRMTGHGYRSLASTILNEKHYSPDVIERQLAHEDSDKIRSAYNRAEYLPERKKMMQDYADYLGGVLVEAEKKVVRGDFRKTKI
jgi:integrase